MKRKRFRLKIISRVRNGQKRRDPTNTYNVSRFATLAPVHIDMPILDSTESSAPKPYIKNGIELIIPHDSADKYRWWSGGQSVFDTLIELNAPDEVIGNYTGKILTPATWRRWMILREKT